MYVIRVDTRRSDEEGREKKDQTNAEKICSYFTRRSVCADVYACNYICFNSDDIFM